MLLRTLITQQWNDRWIRPLLIFLLVFTSMQKYINLFIGTRVTNHASTEIRFSWKKSPFNSLTVDDKGRKIAGNYYLTRCIFIMNDRIQCYRTFRLMINDLIVLLIIIYIIHTVIVLLVMVIQVLCVWWHNCIHTRFLPIW